MLVYGCAGLLVLIIGVLGLFEGSWPRKMLEAWINVHALFGLLLCALVLARCQWRIKRSPSMLPADFREFSRHLSHIVYLMLYAVVGVRLSIAILSSIGHGGAANFGLVDDPFRIGPDRATLRPNADLQLFLVSGLLALVIVRVMAFKLWRSSVERAAMIKPAVGSQARHLPDCG
jgi:cytochrome b561